MKNFRAFTESLTRSVVVDELPDDMQDLLFQFFELDDQELPDSLPLVRLPLTRFPDLDMVMSQGDERGETYARDMFGVPDLPPVIVSGKQWLDGRHRVWAAKQQGHTSIDAIDLSGFGISYREWELLPE